jgi:hypothetical protein
MADDRLGQSSSQLSDYRARYRSNRNLEFAKILPQPDKRLEVDRISRHKKIVSLIGASNQVGFELEKRWIDNIRFSDP